MLSYKIENRSIAMLSWCKPTFISLFELRCLWFILLSQKCFREWTTHDGNSMYTLSFCQAVTSKKCTKSSACKQDTKSGTAQSIGQYPIDWKSNVTDSSFTILLDNGDACPTNTTQKQKTIVTFLCGRTLVGIPLMFLDVVLWLRLL